MMSYGFILYPLHVTEMTQTVELFSFEINMMMSYDNDNDNESNFIAMNYIDHIIGDIQAGS